MHSFCPLNLHSYFSLLEGISSPEALAARGSAEGCPALALTDHNLISGAVGFSQACRKLGIRPLLGLEVDLLWTEAADRLILLAMDGIGWANICLLSSLIHLEPERAGCLETVARFSDGLIAISGDQHDPSGERLGKIAECFPGRIYAALSDPDGKSPWRMHQQKRLAQSLRIPVVAMHPVFTLEAGQAALQRTVAAIREIKPLGKLPPTAVAPVGTYFLGREEMTERYEEFPEALAATLEIADRCSYELPIGAANLPELPLPAGKTAAQVLRGKAESGARKYYGQITPELQARLDHELTVIAERGFEPVFLIVEEVLNYAREIGVPTSSRGSAAGSLVAHCLGITSPDPLALDLYFERFLNPARVTPPDIDTDLCSRGRDRVIQHVFDLYGADRVAMVATINRFRPRSALADVAKAHGLSPEKARELTNTLPYAFWARRETEDEGNVPKSPFKELRRTYPQFSAIYAEAEALLGIPRHLSVHPGGLIVAPGKLTDLTAVMRSGAKGVIITQLDLESVEALGLVKIDMLGIRGLTVLGDVADAIFSWRRTEFAGPLDVLDVVPLDDAPTAERVETGATVGCFQIESPGMRSVLRDIHARTLDDIMVALALYRPGPLQGGLKDAFVRRFRGEETPVQLHPALSQLLAETYGVILYQEQVLRIAADLGGMSLAEGDMLRRAMSHFDPGKQMQVLKEKFIRGAEERRNVPPDVGERIWELMAAFAGYGFPKAHAASYAQVAWRSAWCKTHFPAEFMAAVLANWGGYYSQRVYLNEARRMGLKIQPPDVNHAQCQFSVAYPEGEAVLYVGMDQVRDLTGRTQERILRGRPFHSIEDFLARVDPRRGEAENLALAGGLGEFGPVGTILARVRGGSWRSGQMSLFNLTETPDEEWTLERLVEAQQAVLGISLAAHPLELCASEIAKAGAVNTLEAAGRTGQKVTVAGVRQTSHRGKTAKGEAMLFLSLEDLEGTLDVVLFPDMYRRVRAWIGGNDPLLVTGVIEVDASRGEPLLRAEKIERICHVAH